MHNPVNIEVAPANATADRVTQRMIRVDSDQKRDLLAHLIDTQQWHQVLVFNRTKHGADKLQEQLMFKGIKAQSIHGDKSQAARSRALRDFKTNRVHVLVATDVAARGLDIDHLPYVVNFDLPQVAADYVHRIGRTGRAGAEGEAISLVSNDEIRLLRGIERLLNKRLDNETIEGFEPRPPSRASRSARPSRPPARSGGRPQQGNRSGDYSARPAAYGRTNSRDNPRTANRSDDWSAQERPQYRRQPDSNQARPNGHESGQRTHQPYRSAQGPKSETPNQTRGFADRYQRRPQQQDRPARSHEGQPDQGSRRTRSNSDAANGWNKDWAGQKAPQRRSERAPTAHARSSARPAAAPSAAAGNRSGSGQRRGGWSNTSNPGSSVRYY